MLGSKLSEKVLTANYLFFCKLYDLQYQYLLIYIILAYSEFYLLIMNRSDIVNNLTLYLYILKHGIYSLRTVSTAGHGWGLNATSPNNHAYK